MPVVEGTVPVSYTHLMAPESEQQLTPAGRAMAAFGTHPRLARMLLRARELESEGLTGIVADAAFLVALLEEDLDVYKRQSGGRARRGHRPPRS